MYTLYGFKGSGSAAVECALEVAGIDYQRVDAASWEASSALEALRKVNPLEQIPALVLPDGSAMTESAAILIHLGLTFPASGLLPTNEASRAQVIRGLVYIAANCYAAIGIIDFPERFCQDIDETTRERIRAGSRARLHHYWDVFADTFPSEPYLTGQQLGALDLLAAVVSKWSGSRKHLEQSRPAFYATLMRIEADPRVRAVFARHWGQPS